MDSILQNVAAQDLTVRQVAGSGTGAGRSFCVALNVKGITVTRLAETLAALIGQTIGYRTDRTEGPARVFGRITSVDVGGMVVMIRPISFVPSQDGRDSFGGGKSEMREMSGEEIPVSISEICDMVPFDAAKSRKSR